MISLCIIFAISSSHFLFIFVDSVSLLLFYYITLFDNFQHFSIKSSTKFYKVLIKGCCLRSLFNHTCITFCKTFL
ncbi:capsid assembly scaffolding protein [Bacillus phage BSTP6]|uniref:Capsid assembly scaffolding protein n=1 Tax=Bacillus phage BSTP6 TaxID=2801531 RepID=A0A889INY6_9CAUD|nr:capsid assembly scaffolding protein [Bacillus phage BSTP6]